MTASAITRDIGIETTELSRKDEVRVVLASTVGTLFEWYDFFIYGSLAVFLSAVIFPPNNPTASLLASLGALAAGFIVRPLGAILFGHLGDKFGRKITFLVTVLLMGGATVLMGCLPSYESVGNLSWILLLLLRLVQGLAVGGEYGGAVIYVAEHCNVKRRGLLTGYIQITGTAGLLLCLVVILTVQSMMSTEDFKAWGWRIPFILSLLLLVISVYVRTRLHESPVFEKMKKEKELSANPVKEAFTKWSSLKMMLLAIVGVTAGMGATYFTGQFYVMIFLQQVVQIPQTTVYLLILISFAIGLPTYILFARLSDKIGRKWLLVAGLLLSALSYRPMFSALIEAGNPALATAVQTKPVTIHADGDSAACQARFSAALLGSHPDNKKPCVMAKRYIVSKGINFEYAAQLPGSEVAMTVDKQTVSGFDSAAYAKTLRSAGYPDKADPATISFGKIILILVLMTAMVGLIYGPVAAYLVEFFPAKIRYTSLSFPYHIGAGVIGGSLPFVATYLAVAHGNVLAGLWYPIIITTVVGIIGALFLPSTEKLMEDAGEEF
jgi:MFS family permease